MHFWSSKKCAYLENVTILGETILRVDSIFYFLTFSLFFDLSFNEEGQLSMNNFSQASTFFSKSRNLKNKNKLLIDCII